MTDSPWLSGRRYAILVALLLLLHLAVLMQLLQRGAGMFIDSEEGFIAFTAHELMVGPSEPWTAYIYSDYESGTLLVSLLTVPMFRLFGENLLALRLVSIGLSVSTLLLAILLGARLFGRAAGLFAGLLLALGPAPWLVRGIQTLGDTSESLLFILAQWLLFRMARDRSGVCWMALLGLVCGLGLTFSLAVLPSLLLLLCYLWLERRNLGYRLLAVGALGFCAGLALPLWNVWAHQIYFTRWRGIPLGNMFGSAAQSWAALTGLLSAKSMHAFSLDFAVGAEQTRILLWMLRSYWIAVLLCFAACAWRSRPGQTDRSGERLMVLLFGLYLLAYILDAHRRAYLLLLLVPFGALLVASTLEQALRARRRWVALPIGLLCLIQLSPLVGLRDQPATQDLHRQPLPPMDCWRWRLSPFVERWRFRIEQASAGGPRLPALTANEAYNIGLMLAGEDEPSAVLTEVAGTQQIRIADRLARGFGFGLAWRQQVGPGLARRWSGLPPRLLAGLLFGVGHGMGERYYLHVDHWLHSLADELSAEQRRQLIRGIGYGYGVRFWRQPALFEKIRYRVPQGYGIVFYGGLLERLGRDFPAEQQRALRRAYPFSGRGFETYTGRVGPVEIDATRAARSNLSVDRQLGMVLDGGSRPAFAAYRFRIVDPGQYSVWLHYATTDPRPTRIALDGKWVIPHASPLTTGGFSRKHLLWVRLDQLYLTQGEHRLRIEATGRLFPNLSRIRLVPEF